MSTFTTPLELEYIDGTNWKLTAEFDFASEVIERIIRCPKNMLTDFASIPRMLWDWMPPTGEYGKSCVVHDYCYRTTTFQCSRKDADDVLMEGMKVLGVGWFTRNIIYGGVRAGGHWAWQERVLPEQRMVQPTDIDSANMPGSVILRNGTEVN